MGTPEFACVILQRLYESSHQVVGVFAQPDKPVGRGQKMQSPPVALFAKEKKLPLFQPLRIRDAKVLQNIKDLVPDFIVVAAYGKILPAELLEIPKFECLNVHASLLPQYRGAAPIHYALWHDEKETGVTIMRVVEKLDAGPIFLEKKIKITDADTALTLTGKLADLGAWALIETLDSYQTDWQPKQQDESQATCAPKLKKEMALIDWTKSARRIFNQIRALQPWPIAETTLARKRLRIFAANVLNEKTAGRPGEIVHLSGQGWTVVTGDGVLLVKEVQLDGKKKMLAFEAANGMRLRVGNILG